VTAGNVVRQDPQEGTKLAKGKSVSVWLSSGKGKVKVPNVVGKTQVGAAQELGALGFKVVPKEETNKDKPVGTVLRQNPGAGQEVDAGATVTIVVAAASNTVAVPRLIGMNKDAAVALIDGRKLVATVQEVASTLTGGTVVDQNPKEGQEVPPGSPVTISISNAPVPTTVKVPAVVGLSPAQATATLALFSLRARIVPRETPDYPPDLVIEQSPTAGVEVEKNSYVDIIVSKEPPSTTISVLEAYKTRMKAWFNKYDGKFQASVGAISNIQNLLNASKQEIKAAEDFGNLMHAIVRDLQNIQPPSQLSSAHTDYVQGLQSIAKAADQLSKGLKDGRASEIMDAFATMQASEDQTTQAQNALEKALGFPLSSAPGP